MSARAIGSATISFGLVSIPVKLYSASQPSSAISFNLLHKKCGSRLKQQYICQKDGEKVERDEMVKGYEFAKDRYVTFSPEELNALEEKATQTVEISEFVPLDRIDPIYFDKPYYLGPDRGGDKAYTLLVEAMRRTGRSALARYAARGKQYLVLLRPGTDGLAPSGAAVESGLRPAAGLVMQQLLYADEVRPFAEVPVGQSEVKEPEVQLALQLIEQIATDRFQPEKYEDEVRKRIQGEIQKKVEGQEISLAPAEAPQAQVIDLMEALKASLARTPARPAEAEPTEGSESASAERRPARRSPQRATTTAVRSAKK